MHSPPSLAIILADKPRGSRFTLSRDELLTLPEFVLLSLFPNGLLPEGHMNSYHDGDVYPVDVSLVSKPHRAPIASIMPISIHSLHVMLSNTCIYLSDILYHSQYDPTSLQYMLDFFRHVAQTIPVHGSGAHHGTSSLADVQHPMPIEPMAGNARDMLQDRAGIIVLREDLDFYAIPPRKDIQHPEMLEIKRAAGKALLRQDGIFSGLRKSEEPGTTEQHLIEMLTAGYVYTNHCHKRETMQELTPCPKRLQPQRYLGSPRRRAQQSSHLQHSARAPAHRRVARRRRRRNGTPATKRRRRRHGAEAAAVLAQAGPSLLVGGCRARGRRGRGARHEAQVLDKKSVDAGDGESLLFNSLSPHNALC